VIPPRWGVAALGLLLVLYLGLAFHSARQKAVTVDELGHLPSGLLYLQTGDPRFASLNPPLVNVLSALPVLLLELPADPVQIVASDDPSSFWTTGYQFMEHYREDYLRIFDAARFAPIVIVALLGVLLYGWARRLSPAEPVLAGLLAAGFVLLSPGVIAQARLVGTETGTAFFIALAVLTFRHVLGHQTRAAIVLAGIALGLAQLTKFYGLFLYPTFLVLALVWPRLAPDPTPTLRQLAIPLAVLVGISWLVLNTGYAWTEVGRSLSELQLQSAQLQAWQDSWLGAVPIPLPGAYLRALDGQLVEVASGLPSFLWGERFQGGRWDYYIALLLIKTPIPLILAFVGACVLTLVRPSLPRHEAVVLLAYPVLLFVLLSLGDRRQLGARALLSAVPLVQLWVAVTLARSLPRASTLPVCAILMLWLAAVAVRAHPDHLAYFNAFVGGAEQGHHYASDANIDIGQDLPALADVLEREGAGTIQLLYFGSVDPALYGIDYRVPVGATLEPGLLAVSVSLYHLEYPMYDHGRLTRVGPVRVPGEHIASIGGSIHLYRIADR
jgi:hypothetical protein